MGQAVKVWSESFLAYNNLLQKTLGNQVVYTFISCTPVYLTGYRKSDLACTAINSLYLWSCPTKLNMPLIVTIPDLLDLLEDISVAYWVTFNEEKQLCISLDTVMPDSDEILEAPIKLMKERANFNKIALHSCLDRFLFRGFRVSEDIRCMDKRYTRYVFREKLCGQTLMKYFISHIMDKIWLYS